MPKDRLFSHDSIQAFQFDERVVRVFPDMINRSVPGYGLIVPMLGLLARRFVQPRSRVYDLGCSLGAASLAVAEALQRQDVEIIAIDNSAAMVEQFRRDLVTRKPPTPVKVRLENIEDTEIRNASLVILNFTLQFVSPAVRGALLERICRQLSPGGVLLLSEKICFDDKDTQARLTDWYHDFKRSQGYSELEIANKRNALEDVLIPESLDSHRQRLRQAGFGQVVPWFQCFSFISLVAVKAANPQTNR